MNMQAMLKQAQALQKDMLKIKDEIDKTEFVREKRKYYEDNPDEVKKILDEGTKKAQETAKKTLKDVKINADNLDKDDIEALQDMIIVAINEANNKIDKETEKKMGKFGNIPGLF